MSTWIQTEQSTLDLDPAQVLGPSSASQLPTHCLLSRTPKQLCPTSSPISPNTSDNLQVWWTAGGF